MKMRAPRSLAGLSPRRRLLAGVLLAVVVVLAVAGALRAARGGDATGGADAPAPRHGAPGPATSSRARPAYGQPGAGQPGAPRTADVLLVPGYGGNTTSLRTLAARIRAAGDSATIVTLPSGGTGDLEAQAAVLNGYLNRALRGITHPVDVIGYSAGGVVARLWDVEHEGASKVRLIITLGSPLRGAELAAAGVAVDPSACPVACQQLVPGSALLTRLERIPLPGRPGWLSLWTTDDQTVRPPDSARLAGAVNVPLQSVCPGAVIQHSQLPLDPLVVGIVLRALGEPRLTAPSATECGSLRAIGGAGS